MSSELAFSTINPASMQIWAARLVVAARMAVEDAGGTVLGKPVEIVFADHQNKSDIGAAIARQWFEIGKWTWR